ncbi:MAG: hypothetical protein GXO89_14800, partial [Chlorobi bacterium]|nr:hypothetical protein [Chlorobiota bacterium]
NAVAEITRLFETHWGYALVNAHKTLHYLNFSGEQEGQSVNTDFLF